MINTVTVKGKSLRLLDLLRDLAKCIMDNGSGQVDTDASFDAMMERCGVVSDTIQNESYMVLCVHGKPGDEPKLTLELKSEAVFLIMYNKGIKIQNRHELGTVSDALQAARALTYDCYGPGVDNKLYQLCDMLFECAETFDTLGKRYEYVDKELEDIVIGANIMKVPSILEPDVDLAPNDDDCFVARGIKNSFKVIRDSLVQTGLSVEEAIDCLRSIRDHCPIRSMPDISGVDVESIPNPMKVGEVNPELMELIKLMIGAKRSKEAREKSSNQASGQAPEQTPEQTPEQMSEAEKAARRRAKRREQVETFIAEAEWVYESAPSICDNGDVNKIEDIILTRMIDNSANDHVVIRAENLATAKSALIIAIARVLKRNFGINAYMMQDVRVESGNFGGRFVDSDRVDALVVSGDRAPNIVITSPTWFTHMNVTSCSHLGTRFNAFLRIDIIEKGISVNAENCTVLDLTENINSRVCAWRMYPQQYICADAFNISPTVSVAISKFIKSGSSEEEVKNLLVEACKSADEDRSVIYDTAMTAAEKLGLSEEKKTKYTVVKNLRENLAGRIMGQDQAIDTVSKAMKIACTGLNEEDKPIVSMLFVGPTGTGKTETAKQLADVLDRKLVRVDMSEYVDETAVNRINGASAGYVGYDDGSVFAKLLKGNEECVLLLDEVEKAHPKVFDTLLQILDNGILHDNKGNDINFRKAIIIMTSNSGIQNMDKRALGFNSVEEVDVKNSKGISECVDAALRKTFRPEFINRIDYIIQFDPLSREESRRIAQRMMGKLTKKLPNTVIVSDECYDALADKGMDIKYGAREIKRYINSEIKSSIAEAIVDNEISKDDKIIINFIEGHVNVNFEKSGC